MLHDGHEICKLYHSFSQYTLITLVYTTPDYGITYSCLVCEATAPCDICLKCAVYKSTYLLTYLLTAMIDDLCEQLNI